VLIDISFIAEPRQHFCLVERQGGHQEKMISRADQGSQKKGKFAHDTPEQKMIFPCDKIEMS
jgi:hypothetical protein